METIANRQARWLQVGHKAGTRRYNKRQALLQALWGNNKHHGTLGNKAINQAPRLACGWSRSMSCSAPVSALTMPAGRG